MIELHNNFTAKGRKKRTERRHVCPTNHAWQRDDRDHRTALLIGSRRVFYIFTSARNGQRMGICRPSHIRPRFSDSAENGNWPVGVSLFTGGIGLRATKVF